MTHAALKDLVKKWRDDAGAGYGYRFALTNCADELSAAISAMEGEAVDPIGWVYQHEETGQMTFCTNDGTNTPEVFQRLNPRHILCGPAYTAPPPQQAANTAITQPEPQPATGGEFCLICDMPSGEMAYCSTCASVGIAEAWVNRPSEHPATHPTPSPGPQGGGECETCKGRGEIGGWRHGEGYDSEPCPECATPPAHQPGEVVTDAMVERATTALMLERGREDWLVTPSLKSDMRAALTAALAPKGLGMAANKLEGKAGELIEKWRAEATRIERKIGRALEAGALDQCADELAAALDTARQHEIRDHEHQHSCSYYCDRPECVKAQRDELRGKYVARQSEGMVCIGWEFNDPRDELGWQRLHGVGPESSPPYADPVQVRRIFAAAPADAGEGKA